MPIICANCNCPHYDIAAEKMPQFCSPACAPATCREPAVAGPGPVGGAGDYIEECQHIVPCAACGKDIKIIDSLKTQVCLNCMRNGPPAPARCKFCAVPIEGSGELCEYCRKVQAVQPQSLWSPELAKYHNALDKMAPPPPVHSKQIELMLHQIKIQDEQLHLLKGISDAIGKISLPVQSTPETTRPSDSQINLQQRDIKVFQRYLDWYCSIDCQQPAIQLAARTLRAAIGYTRQTDQSVPQATELVRDQDRT